MVTEEVVEAIEAGRIPVVPIATLETHGPHLPVEVDLRFVEEGTLRAAHARLDLLLAFPPSMYEAGIRLRKDLLAREPELRAGRISLPADPGFGIELDADAVERYRLEGMAA
jgi:L-alanine-DL-glutamate epimerase-like enolase superfamily enzyme